MSPWPGANCRSAYRPSAGWERTDPSGRRGVQPCDAQRDDVRGSGLLKRYPTLIDTAALVRRRRRQGETVRRLIDCLIAAVAIRADAPILHHDADFAALVRHTALRSAS